MKSNSRKLAIFLPALFGGGAERTMLKLAAGFAGKGYPVDLVLARAQGQFLTHVPESVNIIDLKASKDILSVFPLTRYLRRERPGILLSGLHTNLIALWAKRLANVPIRVAVSERNTVSSKSQYYRSDLRMRLMPLLIRSFYPGADLIIAVSHGVAEDLVENIRLPKELIHIIYNPVITAELKEKAKASLDHNWFYPGSPPVIVAVGRLTAQKDFSTLIQAFALVRKTRPARLLILGEGEERSLLESMVKEFDLDQDVALPGFVNNPYPYMTQASLFVLSSRWEGLPGVLIEALYCAPAVVSTDCPSGPREILQNGKFGQLVKVGDVNAMAHAIETILVDPPPRVSPESWSPFEQDYIVDQYIDLFYD